MAGGGGSFRVVVCVPVREDAAEPAVCVAPLTAEPAVLVTCPVVVFAVWVTLSAVSLTSSAVSWTLSVTDLTSGVGDCVTEEVVSPALSVRDCDPPAARAVPCHSIQKAMADATASAVLSLADVRL